MKVLRFPGPVPRGKLLLAAAALVWERGWSSLWPAVFILGFFLALAWLDLLPLLPGWAHVALLALTALALLMSVFHGARKLRWPDHASLLRRIESASSIRHRPLTAVQDTLAAGGGDAASEALWRAHIARMAAAAKNARVGLPRPGVAARDPWALRAIAVIALAAAIPGALQDGQGRIERALYPDFHGTASAAVVEAWVTPPEYTALAPIYLQQDQGSVTVPAGSTLVARVHGGRGRLRLDIGGETIGFEALSKGEHEARATIAAGDKLAVRQGGRELAAWPLSVVPDTPPEVAFLGVPAPTAQGTLRVDFETRDDYGVTKGELLVQRAGTDGMPLGEETVAVPLPLHGTGAAQRSSTYVDLTPHIWAGLPVAARLSVEDALGQKGTSARANFVLPERKFTNPIARAIVEQRKRLTLAPQERMSVAQALEAISQRAERMRDGILLMGLASARGRLLYDRSAEAVAEAQGVMWDLALRAEDGDLSLAARDLRTIEEKLLEALDRNAPDEELRQLFEELRRALDRYMQAMMEQLEQRLRAGEDVPRINRDEMTMDQQDLRKMLEEMRQLMQAGAKDAARQLLAQLRNMLENMRAGVVEQPQGRPNAAGKFMRDLQDLAGKQQQLLEQSFKRMQEGRGFRHGTAQGAQPGQPTSPDNQASAEAQAQLRQQLDELARRFGQLMGQPQNQLGKAGDAMGRAVESFTGNDGGRAVDQQAEALEALREGGRDMARQLMERFNPGGTAGTEQRNRQQGPGRDGTGRTGGLGASTEDVNIPDEMELRRSREILEELRRRAGERGRPALERHYLERLLPRF